MTDEDCLFLDVYVPHTGGNSSVLSNATQAWDMWLQLQQNETATASPDSDSGMAVMVWIHGGAYHSGDSAENEAWKMATEQGVVVVVIQYRLGALGFLSSGSSHLPGNYGLWDQRLALKWVKANIQGFGGEVAMVTVAGESAGSTSVSQHTLSAQSAGLFRRAVMLSGTAEASWCFNHQPRNTFDRFSKDAGCGDNTTSVASRLHCLMTLPADVIYNASVVTEAGNFVTFVPTVDGDFFPDSVARLLQDADYLSSVGFYDYDFLVGTLNNEGVVGYTLLEFMVPSLTATGQFPYVVVDKVLMEALMMQEVGPRHSQDLVDIVNNEYFYPRDPERVSVHVRKVFDVYTDVSFVVPAVKMVRHHVKSGAMSRSSGGSSAGSRSSMKTSASSAGSSRSSGKSYMFFFDWIPSLTEGTMFEGMPHGLDVDYLWGLTNDSLLLYDELPLGGSIQPREHVVSRMYGDMIGAFVRTGDPNKGIGADLKGQWLPYDVSNETFLRFSLNSSIDHHLHADRVSLWVDLVPLLQSRWLNQTANQSPDGQRPTNESESSEKLTYFDLSEDETNALLISLIVVGGVMLLFNLFLFIRLIKVYRRKDSNQYRMGQVENVHQRSGKRN